MPISALSCDILAKNTEIQISTLLQVTVRIDVQTKVRKYCCETQIQGPCRRHIVFNQDTKVQSLPSYTNFCFVM